MAQTELTMEERNEEIVRQFIRAIVNGGNYDLAEEIFAEDYVRHDPTIREEKRGPEGFVETVETFRSAFPDVEMTLHEVLCEASTSPSGRPRLPPTRASSWGSSPPGRRFGWGGT